MLEVRGELSVFELEFPNSSESVELIEPWRPQVKTEHFNTLGSLLYCYGVPVTKLVSDWEQAVQTAPGVYDLDLQLEISPLAQHDSNSNFPAH